MADDRTFFQKLKRGLFMTHTEILEKVKESLTPDLPIDRTAIDGLEEGLLGTDVLLIDTAGRLHNKSHLMQELTKVRRVIEKELPGAPHETLLVIDGTTGQNGVSQAAAFLEAAKVTGMIVTKLDGTAKGGVILSIMRQFDIPVKFVGVGEAADDHIPFDPAAYVETLFEKQTSTRWP